MTFTTIRLVIAALGLLGAGLWLWNIHDGLAAARVTRALERAQIARRADTVEQVKVLEKERAIERRDAEVVTDARQSLSGLDWSACPMVPAEYFRMLNDIGEETSARAYAGEVSDPGAPGDTAAGSGGSEQIPGGGERREVVRAKP